jgi:hypothetical protein
MSFNIFAFNVSTETPITDDKLIGIEGGYDATYQTWIGDWIGRDGTLLMSDCFATLPTKSEYMTCRLWTKDPCVCGGRTCDVSSRDTKTTNDC